MSPGYRCSECGETYNTQTDLEFHIDVSHLRLISNQCWHCHENKVETFKSTEDLLRIHYKQVHPGITCTLLKNIDDDKEAKRKDIIRKSIENSPLVSNRTNCHIASSSILIPITGPTPPRPLGPTPPLAQSSPIVSIPLTNFQVKKENDEKVIKQELMDDGKNGSDQNQQVTSGSTLPATQERKCEYCQELRPDKNYGIDLRTYDTREAKRDHVISHIQSEHDISLRKKSGQIELGGHLPIFLTIFENCFPKVKITQRQSQENTNLGSNQVTTCEAVENRSCQLITSKIVDSNVRLNECDVSISEADQQRATVALEKEKNNDPSFRKVSNDSKRPSAGVKRKEKVFVGPITKKRKIPENAVIEHSAKSRISSISPELHPGAPFVYNAQSTNDHSVAIVPKCSLDKLKDRSPSTTPINIRPKRQVRSIEDDQSINSKRSKRHVTPTKQKRKVEKNVKTNKLTIIDDDDDIIFIEEIQSPVKENRRFHCKTCKGSMKSVIQHLFKIHYKTSVVRCPLCDFPSFFSMVDMRDHIITKHPNSKATPIDSRQKHKQQIKDLWKDHMDDSLPPDFGKIFANEVCKTKIKKEPKNESADEPEIILHQRFVRIGLEDERNSHVTSSPPEVIRESPPEMDKSPPETHTKVQQSSPNENSPPAMNSLAQNSGQSPPALGNEIEIIGEVKMVKKPKSKIGSKNFTMPKKRKGFYCKVCKGNTWKPKAHLYQSHLCQVTVKCPYCESYPGTTFKTADVYSHVKNAHPDKEARIVDERDKEDIRIEVEKLSLKCFGVKVFELKKEHAVECVKADRKENNSLKRVQYGLRPRLQEIAYSDESILRANLLKEAQKEEDEKKRMADFVASHEKPPPEPSCDICGQFCDDLRITEDKLSDHKLICEKVNQFCCNLCPRQFRMRQALTIHKQHKHKDYNCKFCSTKWDPPDLRFQTKEKAGDLCYKFQEKIARHDHLCQWNLKQKALISQNVAAFRFHEEIIENPLFPSREKKSCYMLRGEMKKIAINISPETPKKAKPYSCALCGSRFAQLKSLTIHQIFCEKQREEMEIIQNDLFSTKFNAETPEIEKEKNEFHVEKECIECKETIGTFESNIELHLVLKHLGKYTVKCSQCSFSHLWEKSVIYRHINEKHDTKGCVIDMRNQFRDALKMLRKKLIRSVGGNLESAEKEMSDSNRSSNSGDVLSNSLMSNERNNSSPPELSPLQFPDDGGMNYESENVSDSSGAFSDEDENINNTGVDIAKIIEAL